METIKGSGLDELVKIAKAVVFKSNDEKSIVWEPFPGQKFIVTCSHKAGIGFFTRITCKGKMVRYQPVIVQSVTSLAQAALVGALACMSDLVQDLEA